MCTGEGQMTGEKWALFRPCLLICYLLDPQAPRSFCEVIVWQAPSRAYGAITGYDIMFPDTACEHQQQQCGPEPGAEGQGPALP